MRGAVLRRALRRKSNKISKQNSKFDFIWGVTIDDGWYEDAQDASGAKLQSIVRALQALPVKPTVRVVMSKEISPREYEPLFRRLSEVSYVMACPVDSYEMSSYKNVKSYEKRFADAFAALAPYVQIWEIGNEINGEGWLGDDANFIAAKMIAAFELIHKKAPRRRLRRIIRRAERRKRRCASGYENSCRRI